ncbi:hypothetical protein Barb4_00198 [Bacteroidales bacterium Barb4]|nr:hypothetical protein Barb4_00198 [Bacteroidales bacterium Barb4]
MMNDYLILRRCPEGARDFSPTCSEAECGVYGQYRQGYPERIQDFSPTCSAAECGFYRQYRQGYPERIQDFSLTCSAAECGVYGRYRQGHPERIQDFSPTCSEAEYGVNGDADKEVLKGRPNNRYCIVTPFVFVSFFQNFLTAAIPINPTFRYAACGAEISRPSGTTGNINYKLIFTTYLCVEIKVKVEIIALRSIIGKLFQLAAVFLGGSS